MKKLAIPVENGALSHHFGHSREFLFYEISETGMIKKESKIPPPHAEGTIPKWLIEEKATHLLVGGIGPKAVNMLKASGIDVIIGVEVDSPDNIVVDFINDELKYGQNHCHH